MSWERVIEGGGAWPTVGRSAVPGGWIYASFNSMVFVPEPNKVSAQQPDEVAVRMRRDELGAAYARGKGDGLDYERGHKAGYMQALANHEHDEDEYTRGHKDGYEAAVGDGLKESNAKATERDNVNYYRGFNDALHGNEPVNPHDSEQVAANLGFVGKKKPADWDYPKYLVIGTLPETGAVVAMTHGLWDTHEQAMAYAGTCAKGYKATVVELAKPLYVREGK